MFKAKIALPNDLTEATDHEISMNPTITRRRTTSGREGGESPTENSLREEIRDAKDAKKKWTTEIRTRNSVPDSKQYKFKGPPNPADFESNGRGKKRVAPQTLNGFTR